MQQEQRRQNVGCDGVSCASEIAGSMDAQEIVMGNMGRFGDSLLVTVARVRASDGQVIKRAMVRAPLDKPDALLGPLTSEVDALAGGPPPAPATPPAAPSPAQAIYDEAVQAQRDGRTFLPLFEKAADVDPSFAPAHLKLALGRMQVNPAPGAQELS